MFEWYISNPILQFQSPSLLASSHPSRGKEHQPANRKSLKPQDIKLKESISKYDTANSI